MLTVFIQPVQSFHVNMEMPEMQTHVTYDTIIRSFKFLLQHFTTKTLLDLCIGVNFCMRDSVFVFLFLFVLFSWGFFPALLEVTFCFQTCSLQ